MCHWARESSLKRFREKCDCKWSVTLSEVAYKTLIEIYCNIAILVQKLFPDSF